ncbi:AI-2E family transporter [Streptomyces sp. WA1-19]|nr:AI-2E family transporter [Streptomyces sp. M10]MCG5121646.1 AI-2E family transporter [Streptomyces sp. T7(2022)]MCK2140575.1 AI-2E family transporter [Streptomyces sp. WAC00276]MCQ9710210.1 AI-2E family transporter [Streptomyces sp. BSP1]MCR0991104.1 AI-2E family transporter [Streptomyces albidoflavus]UDF07670.1 AI-2E family transporter [Streptomyces sp. WA1-19]UYX93296.1 AI-2E family transporter [Streptomyces sp. BI87]
MSSTDESASPADRPATGPVPEPDRPPLGSAMPRWLPRAMVMALALVAVFQLGTWAFHQLTSLLINILIAFFLALAVEPAVSWMAARGMRRGLATAAVFLGLLVASAGFVTLLGSMLAGQIVDMVEDFPEYLDSVISWTNETFHTDLSRLEVQDSLVHSDWLRRYVQNSATGVLDISAQVLGGLFQLLTLTLFAFYFAADGPRLRRALCSVLPPARQAEVLRAWEIAVDKTGGYLYSRGLMALISGVAHYVLLQWLGVPYAPALAVWVGLVSQFIPTIGTYLAGALAMLIAFTVDPWYALWVLGFVVVYQQFENYMLQPKLTAKTVDIHPAVAFGSVIAGTALLGAVGALIAIPAVATLQAFLGAYVRRYDVHDEARVSGHRRRAPGPVLLRVRKALRLPNEETAGPDVITPSEPLPGEEGGATRAEPGGERPEDREDPPDRT